EWIRTGRRICEPDPVVGRSVIAVGRPGAVAVDEAPLPNAGAEPDLVIPHIRLEQLLKIARWLLVHREDGGLGRRLGDPLLGAGPQVRALPTQPCPGAAPMTGAG